MNTPLLSRLPWVLVQKNCQSYTHYQKHVWLGFQLFHRFFQQSQMTLVRISELSTTLKARNDFSSLRRTKILWDVSKSWIPILLHHQIQAGLDKQGNHLHWHPHSKYHPCQLFLSEVSNYRLYYLWRSSKLLLHTSLFLLILPSLLFLFFLLLLLPSFLLLFRR